MVQCNITATCISNAERAVTGLAVVLSLTLAGVIVAILTVVIFIIKRRMSHDNAFMSSNGNLNSCIAALTFDSEKLT